VQPVAATTLGAGDPPPPPPAAALPAGLGVAELLHAPTTTAAIAATAANFRLKFIRLILL